MRASAAALALVACLLLHLAPAFAGQCEKRRCFTPVACAFNMAVMYHTICLACV